MRPDDTAALPQGHAQAMKSVISVTVYGQPTNNAPIHMPGRSYPGVALQADTLHLLIMELREAHRLVASGEVNDGLDELEGTLERLSDIQSGLISELRHAGDEELIDPLWLQA